MTPTLYDILGVPPDASRDEIKAAWRDAADRFEPGAGASTAQFRLFNEAAEVLLDPERRREYDAELAAHEARSVEPAAAQETPAEPEHETDGATAVPAAEVKHRRPVPMLVLALLGVLAAALAGVATYLGVQAERTEAYAEALEQAPQAAERSAAAILSYDHESLEADRDAAARFMTADYRDEYVKTFDALVVDNAEETEAVVQADVRASAAMSRTGDRDDPDRISVLLFVNQTTESTAHEEPSLALNRVRFDMAQVDGSWRVDHITSY